MLEISIDQRSRSTGDKDQVARAKDASTFGTEENDAAYKGFSTIPSSIKDISSTPRRYRLVVAEPGSYHPTAKDRFSCFTYRIFILFQLGHFRRTLGVFWEYRQRFLGLSQSWCDRGMLYWQLKYGSCDIKRFVIKPKGVNPFQDWPASMLWRGNSSRTPCWQER